MKKLLIVLMLLVLFCKANAQEWEAMGGYYDFNSYNYSESNTKTKTMFLFENKLWFNNCRIKIGATDAFSGHFYWDGLAWHTIASPSIANPDLYYHFYPDSTKLVTILDITGNTDTVKKVIASYNLVTGWQIIDTIPLQYYTIKPNNFPISLFSYKGGVYYSYYHNYDSLVTYRYKNKMYKRVTDYDKDGNYPLYPVTILDGEVWSLGGQDTVFKKNYTSPILYDGEKYKNYGPLDIYDTKPPVIIYGPTKPLSGYRPILPIFATSIVKHNKLIYAAGTTYFGGKNATPLYMVQVFNGVDKWLEIGDERMHKYRDNFLLVHKNDLYAVGTLKTDDANGFLDPEGGGYVFKYNGVTWDDITPDYINGAIRSCIVYKDQLYIQGNFTKIGNQDISGIARISLLNKANIVPTAQAEQVNITEDVADTLHIKVNDSDANEDYLLCSIINVPKHGTATVLPSDELYYIPTANYHGADSITYSMCDRGGLCDTATVRITVVPVNDAPICQTDNVSTTKNESLTIYPLQNDTDAENHSIDLQLITTPQFGTANFSKDTIFYTPQVNSIGTDIFFYTACDELNACSQGKVSVLVKNGTSGVGNAQLQAFTVYPNPIHEAEPLQVSWEKSAKVVLKLLDVQGKTISYQQAEGTQTVIATEGLPSGLYLLQVQRNNTYQSFKIIKE